MKMKKYMKKTVRKSESCLKATVKGVGKIAKHVHIVILL